jgi:hypothetical protein
VSGVHSDGCALQLEVGLAAGTDTAAVAAAIDDVAAGRTQRDRSETVSSAGREPSVTLHRQARM